MLGKTLGCVAFMECLMSRLFGSALIPVFICILGANVGAAERNSTANPVPQDYADTTGDFLKTITENRSFILQAARLAIETSRDAMVKKLAQDIIRSHERGYSDVGRSVPAVSGQTFESQGALRPEQVTALGELKKAGDKFDLIFIDSLVVVLRDNLDNFQKYAVGGTNAKLKEAAADGVTEETADLVAAEGLQTEIHDRR
jgi:predicted outer membrane protein